MVSFCIKHIENRKIFPPVAQQILLLEDAISCFTYVKGGVGAWGGTVTARTKLWRTEESKHYF